MRVGLLEVAVTLRIWLSLPAPLEIPVRFNVCAGLLAFKVMLSIASRVGASFTEFTVTWNVLVTILFEVPPSFTVTVIVAVPFPFTAGLRLRLPLAFGLV